MSQELEALSLDELRRRRDELREREETVSYRRRLLQAQLDIVEASATANDPEELAVTLARVLSDPPATSSAPVRSVRISGSPLDGEVEPLPKDLMGLDDSARADLQHRLRGEERDISDKRRRILDELDALQDAIVARFRRDGVDAKALLGDTDR
jgi:hypothetical protein